MIKDTSGQDTVLVPSTSKRLKLPLIIGGCALLVSALVWASLGSDSVSKSLSRSDITTAKLFVGTLTRDVATTGKIVAANAPILYSTEEGTVTLLSNPGDTVNKGDVVAKLDSPRLTNQLEQAKSLLAGMESALERAKLDARRDQLQAYQTLDIATVDLEAADRESRRGEELIQSQLIGQIDYEKGKDDLHKAKLKFKHAEQEVALTKDTLTFEIKNKALEVERQTLAVRELERQVDALNIVAPVNGIIGNWITEQKTRLSANQPILTVVDLSAYEAELAVPESYADDLGLGMEVELSFGSIKLMGKLSSISPEVRNREVTARVQFDQSDSLTLRQNQRISARVLLEHRPNVLMVKRGAFMTSGGGNVAYQIEGDLASRREVKLGSTSLSQVEVLDGGKAGDEWVISSVDPFNHAEQVRIH
ncbi:efflux RND transporter periplasmic adaptor subunit [Shewanella oncorhynchi]|jgi:HlyD family secretion protein|uniref:HlyD family efflux transporter periplasmic adaptor subunit n=1 Tax=Shewanella oncorhynchi TaxID=2726434 RepID=A0ABX1KGX7_9GAMM|nr:MULTISPECIES: HlyD family efflux transporter periplasmic adaptor subunit [Shewanella]MCU8013193.1 HlyD family efflux transporter periplasmic adaptor subunit [Shewanella sp. SM74]MCU8030336.1 HlyD family efflux transporter periplasmic adaptor subunit [Shewanella sp. SM73]MCU8058555.1 HlyD family efflux transporter periplasmic adaptor subunit [Shewanella sp. SM35]MCU8067507.1 HlyD family efflux transporter periplasmic adaptor subunit [Shewanella sp. SM34]MCU8106859.1 HlyD family efflux transp